MKNNKIQQINLKSGGSVIIGYHTRTKCPKCKKEIFYAAGKSKNGIVQVIVELVGLAQWDVHLCTP